MQFLTYKQSLVGSLKINYTNLGVLPIRYLYKNIFAVLFIIKNVLVNPLKTQIFHN